MMQRMTEPWPMKRMSAGSRSSSRMTGSRLRASRPSLISEDSSCREIEPTREGEWDAPDAQVVVALGARVPVRVRVRLGPLELLGELLLDLVDREAVDVARVELVDLLPLDDLVPELGHGARRRDAAAAGRRPDLHESTESQLVRQGTRSWR